MGGIPNCENIGRNGRMAVIFLFYSVNIMSTRTSSLFECVEILTTVSSSSCSNNGVLAIKGVFGTNL